MLKMVSQSIMKSHQTAIICYLPRMHFAWLTPLEQNENCPGEIKIIVWKVGLLISMMPEVEDLLNYGLDF